MISELTVLFIRDLPRSVHREFKARCARRGISMKDRIIELMQIDIDNDVTHKVGTEHRPHVTEQANSASRNEETLEEQCTS